MNIRLIVCGALFAFGGSAVLYSSLAFQLHGVATTGALRERGVSCQVEYQLVTEDHKTYKDMDCKAANLFQQMAGANKVIVNRNEYAKIAYAAPDGGAHETNLAANSVPADVAIGGPVTIFVDPDHPEKARAPLSLGEVGWLLGMIVVGALALLFGLGLRPRHMPMVRVAAPREEAEPDWIKAADDALARARTATPVYAPAAPPSFGKRRTA